MLTLNHIERSIMKRLTFALLIAFMALPAGFAQERVTGQNDRRQDCRPSKVGRLCSALLGRSERQDADGDLALQRRVSVSGLASDRRRLESDRAGSRTAWGSARRALRAHRAEGAAGPVQLPLPRALIRTRPNAAPSKSRSRNRCSGASRSKRRKATGCSSTRRRSSFATRTA